MASTMRICWFLLLLQTVRFVTTVDIYDFFDTHPDHPDDGWLQNEYYKYDLEISDDMFIRDEKVDLKVYYETHCPFCIHFDTEDLVTAVKKLDQYLNIHMYPYGNAETIVYPNGTYEFKCQHGPDECYGNKLDACAINLLSNITEAILFNACMMNRNQSNGMSDDNSADKCGDILNIDAGPIKECAKGPKGSELLKHYGEESKKVHFPGVPYVLINGAEFTEDDLVQALCAAFKHPPPPCSHQNLSVKSISKQGKCLKNN